MQLNHFTIILNIGLVLCVNIAWSVESRNNCSANAKNYTTNELLLLGLSPFAAHAYQLFSSAGVFDQIFDSSFIAPEAEAAFYSSTLEYGQRFGVPIFDSSHPTVWQVAADVFSDKVIPMDYFKVIANMVDSYLLEKSLLTRDNVQDLADSYYRHLYDKLQSIKGVNHPAQSLFVIGVGFSDFLEHILEEVTPEEAKYVMLKFIDEMSQLKKSRN